MNVSVERTPGMRTDVVVQEGEQVIVVLAHELEEQVETIPTCTRRSRPRGSRRARRPLQDVAGDLHADHGLAAEAERERIGDRDDLHDLVLDEPLHALAHCGLRQPDLRASRGVGEPAVVLEQLDERLVGVVERRLGARRRFLTEFRPDHRLRVSSRRAPRRARRRRRRTGRCRRRSAAPTTSTAPRRPAS